TTKQTLCLALSALPPFGPGILSFSPAEPFGPGILSFSPAEPFGPGILSFSPAEPFGPGILSFSPADPPPSLHMTSCPPPHSCPSPDPATDSWGAG
uniref:Uncharacterized protein n=1 Tax=Esox lucius TaxID=8010 RepID=A0AAY5K2V3_ESOLU